MRPPAPLALLPVALLAATLALAAGTGKFVPHPVAPSFGAGNNYTVALGDLDGDGDLDALVAVDVGAPETVWMNNGSGSFTPHPVTPSFGAGASQMAALGDIDGDGDLDAVVANTSGQAETVWLNNGSGSFSAHPTTPSFGAGNSFAVTLGDIDGDGDLDALVARTAGGTTVWLNNGSGSFSAHPTVPTLGAGFSFHVSLGDIDGDGDLDAVVANFNGEPETVWLNIGSGAFIGHPVASSFGTGSSIATALADLDGDGDLDIVVANHAGEAETVWLNNGAGVYTPHPTQPAFGAGTSVWVALGDINGDGAPDALVVNFGAPLTAWLNTVTHVISTTVSPPAGGSASCTPNPVATGNSSTCTATPNAGYSFAGWSGACSGATCTPTAVIGGLSVTANFVLNSYAIATAANPLAGGTVGCAPNPVPHGSGSTCTATPNAGFTFANWSGDCVGATCTPANVTAALSVTANFTPVTYAIATATIPLAGGSVTCTPNPVAHGSGSTCNATPNAGFAFVSWSGDCTGATCALTNVTSAKSVTATFSALTYAIATAVSPAASGTVSCAPNPVGHAGTSTCTATPNAGFAFVSWSGDCTGTTCNLTNVTAAKSVTATFSALTYAITTTASPLAGGTVSCTPNPIGHAGTSTCTATPNAGYAFANWSGDCGGASCTLANVTSAKSVTAVFTTVLKTFTGASATGSGSITATFTGGGAACTYGTSQFIPVTGHARSPPPGTAPTAVSFPHGLFDFTLAGCTAGSTITMTITYPGALPPGTLYWKYGPEPGNTAAHWYVLPSTLAGNVITFTITDGNQGDDDLVANGTIVDQGGPGVPPGIGGPIQTPTMSQWAMILMALLMLGTAGFLSRKGRPPPHSSGHRFAKAFTSSRFRRS